MTKETVASAKLLVQVMQNCIYADLLASSVSKAVALQIVNATYTDIVNGLWYFKAEHAFFYILYASLLNHAMDPKAAEYKLSNYYTYYLNVECFQPCANLAVGLPSFVVKEIIKIFRAVRKKYCVIFF